MYMWQCLSCDFIWQEDYIRPGFENTFNGKTYCPKCMSPAAKISCPTEPTLDDEEENQ